MTMNTECINDDLASWAGRAVQALQELCDEAQEAAEDPDGESERWDIRALIREYEDIVAGRPVWQRQLFDQDS